ncbi:hypothetical protein SAMN05421846_102376 [Chryseobacterium taeanense]|uniref:Uncharacterized protein n=1 Tax=Chryseobacterium taeanense TaxID=311334 RepID=A0A1G8G114_9FLAO|nr:hypothetical protein [Chryseobacterium taeanense]SDH88081.1 hypothetical protein SAMN05421846_102376 [Chryseobacterium taeanense]
MKSRLFMFLFVMMSFFAVAQTKQNSDDAAIKKSLNYFANSIMSKKIDQAVNCIYPKFFTVVPKDQMTQILNMTYNNPFMKIEINNMKFGNIEKPELINGEYFSIAHYIFTMKCNMSSLNDEMKKQFSTMLTKRYGQNNVKYLPKEGAYLINATMKACAVSKDRKSWKFVILEKEYKPNLVKVLPKKILDKL